MYVCVCGGGGGGTVQECVVWNKRNGAQGHGDVVGVCVEVSRQSIPDLRGKLWIPWVSET